MVRQGDAVERQRRRIPRDVREVPEIVRRRDERVPREARAGARGGAKAKGGGGQTGGGGAREEATGRGRGASRAAEGDGAALARDQPEQLLPLAVHLAGRHRVLAAEPQSRVFSFFLSLSSHPIESKWAGVLPRPATSISP